MIDFKNYGDQPKQNFKTNKRTYLLLILFFISCVCFAYLIGDLALHLK